MRGRSGRSGGRVDGLFSAHLDEHMWPNRLLSSPPAPLSCDAKPLACQRLPPVCNQGRQQRRRQRWPQLPLHGVALAGPPAPPCCLMGWGLAGSRKREAGSRGRRRAQRLGSTERWAWRTQLHAQGALKFAKFANARTGAGFGKLPNKQAADQQRPRRAICGGHGLSAAAEPSRLISWPCQTTQLITFDYIGI